MVGTIAHLGCANGCSTQLEPERHSWITLSSGQNFGDMQRVQKVQFENLDYEENVYPLIRSKKNLERVFEKIKEKPGIVLCTLVDDEISKELESFCNNNEITYMPFMNNIVSMIEDETGIKAIKMPGGQHKLNDEYFKRIEALNFTLEHDDGQNIETITKAEIILVGVSRTSKTPTCIYLANQGIKAANIPLVPNQDLPKFDKSKNLTVIALITTPQNLVEVRKKRAIELGLDPKKDEYTNINSVTKEIDDAKRLFNKMGWPTIDTTRRSVEETAAAIMSIRAQE